jgi:tryptophan synthase alpha chain
LSDAPIAATWARLRGARRPGLVTYLTAGFPSHEVSREALQVADELADVIEVGVPFSDPLADGPTIQRSTFQALEAGMTLPRTLELVQQARLARPVVIFSYLNPILRYGVDAFLRDAASLGIAGLLLTDLPAGSDPGIEHQVQSSPLDLIRLVAPTTRPDRLARSVSGAQGFLYLVSRLGVTGASATLATDLEASIARVRAASPLPVAVGFGISTAEQAARVGRLADGVVVGSALVDRLAADGVRGVRELLSTLRGAVDRTEAAA